MLWIVQFTAKEVARELSEPSALGLLKLKRTITFLRDRPSAALLFRRSASLWHFDWGGEHQWRHRVVRHRSVAKLGAHAGYHQPKLS